MRHTKHTAPIQGWISNYAGETVPYSSDLTTKKTSIPIIKIFKTFSDMIFFCNVQFRSNLGGEGRQSAKSGFTSILQILVGERVFCEHITLVPEELVEGCRARYLSNSVSAAVALFTKMFARGGGGKTCSLAFSNAGNHG